MTKEKESQVQIVECNKQTRMLKEENGEEYPCRQCAEIAFQDKIYALFQEEDAPQNQNRDKIITALEVVLEEDKAYLQPIVHESVMHTLIYIYEQKRAGIPQEQIVPEEGRTFEEMFSGVRAFTKELKAWVSGQMRTMVWY